MKSLTVICVFTLLIGVWSHARLQYPKPYNPNPSQATPCGGAAALTIPAAIWTQGDTLNMTWVIVAGDGNGQVIMSIDTSGGTSFSGPNAVNIPLVGTNPTSGDNKPYYYNFQVPLSLTCTSANKMCPVQVHSASWYACTNVEVKAFVAAASSTGGSGDDHTAAVDAVQCETVTAASLISYCLDIVGTDVQIGAGETPKGVDDYVKNTFYQNINNTNVFLNGTNNPECRVLYKNFLCESSFPPCGAAVTTGLRTGGSCRQQCMDTMAACGVTNIHSGLYNCDSYPLTCFACRFSTVSLMASILLPLFMAIYNRL